MANIAFNQALALAKPSRIRYQDGSTPLKADWVVTPNNTNSRWVLVSSTGVVATYDSTGVAISGGNGPLLIAPDVLEIYVLKYEDGSYSASSDPKLKTSPYKVWTISFEKGSELA